MADSLNPIYSPGYNIFDKALFTGDEIKEYISTLKGQMAYTAMLKVLNASETIFYPLVNALKLELITLQEVNNLEMKDTASIIEFLTHRLKEQKLVTYTDGEYQSRQFVFERDCSFEDPDCSGIDPESEGFLGLGRDLLPIMRNKISDTEYLNIKKSCLKFSFFSSEQKYDTYVNLEEFELDFEELVLPRILSALNTADLISVFPYEEVAILNDIDSYSITTNEIKQRARSIYRYIFEYYLPVLNNEHIYKLLISSPLLKSKAEAALGFTEGLANFFYPYINTSEVINEIISIMNKFSELQITPESNTLAYLMNERNTEIFRINPALLLNRYLLFGEVRNLVSESMEASQEILLIDYIEDKLEKFQICLRTIYVYALQSLKVSNLHYN